MNIPYLLPVHNSASQVMSIEASYQLSLSATCILHAEHAALQNSNAHIKSAYEVVISIAYL